MIVVVAPTPASWLAPTVAALERVDRVVVWAPWAMPGWAQRAPGPVGAFARRRQRPGDRGRLAWPIVDGVARAWAGDRVDRRHRLEQLERQVIDRGAAWWLARLPTVRAVVAPTGAARATFAAARQRGAVCALLVDGPWLRQLGDDLDRAAAALPDRARLRRYRAPRAAVVTQESEVALAAVVAVRGHAAADLARSLGAPRVCAVPTPPPPIDRAGPPRSPSVVCLAGGPTARAGLDVALALLARDPELCVRVRRGDPLDRAELPRHPRLVVTPTAAEAIAGAGAVLAPSWCEAYPLEVALAAQRGVPIAATRVAAGFAAVHPILAGDVERAAAALAQIAAGLPAPAAAPPLPSLTAALTGYTARAACPGHHAATHSTSP